MQPPIPTPPAVHNLFDWWWDSMGLDRAQVVLGLLGTLLAAAAVIYAWLVARRQFKLMDDQGKIIDKQLKLMHEQTEAAKHLEVLTVEQGAIMKRQGEIAETQHAIMLEQQARKTDLRVRSGLQTRSWSSDRAAYGPAIVLLLVQNGGTAAADGFHWQIYIPRALTSSVRFVDEAREEIPGVFSPMSETDYYDGLDGHYTHKLFPGSRVSVTRLAVEAEHAVTQEFTIKWRIAGPDGMVPPTGLGEIRFRKVPDGTYEVMHPDPHVQDTGEPQ